jgi:RAD51-like protein 2
MAVVVTNQMTTKVVSRTLGDQQVMVPALGDSWGHSCTNRIILFWRNKVRHAWLVKSAVAQDMLVPFDITVFHLTRRRELGIALENIHFTHLLIQQRD